MKKNLLLLLMATLTIATYAQKGLDIGVFGTFTNTYIWRQNNYGTLQPFLIPVVRQSEMNYKATWGGTGGGEIGYNFTNNYGIKVGVQYCLTGQKYEDNFQGPASLTPGDTIGFRGYINVKRVVRLTYVQIPVMFKYTSNGKVAKFYAALGPLFGIRTTAYEQVLIFNTPYDALNFTPEQKFRTFDAGIALQFGVDIYATRHLYIELGLSGYLGITDLNGKALKDLGWYDKNHLDYQQSHNTSAGLTLGIHYIFKQKGKGAGALDETDKKKKKPSSAN